MFGDIFSEKHPVEGYITCGKCGKHINYHSPLATQVYCPNCWNKIDVDAIKPEQIHPHKYNPETGKLIEFNDDVLRQIAKLSVKNEQKQKSENTKPYDMLLTTYKLNQKMGKSIEFFNNEMLDIDNKEFLDSLIQKYIKYKQEYRKELGIEGLEIEKEIQNGTYTSDNK